MHLATALVLVLRLLRPGDGISCTVIASVAAARAHSVPVHVPVIAAWLAAAPSPPQIHLAPSAVQASMCSIRWNLRDVLMFAACFVRSFSHPKLRRMRCKRNSLSRRRRSSSSNRRRRRRRRRQRNPLGNPLRIPRQINSKSIQKVFFCPHPIRWMKAPHGPVPRPLMHPTNCSSAPAAFAQRIN